MVEVAVALPFLLVIVIALIELGILGGAYVALVNAAREGAVFASMCPIITDPTKDSCNPDTCSCIRGSTIPNVQEYRNRVNDEIVPSVAEPLVSGRVQIEDPTCNVGDPFWGYKRCLKVDRPVLGPAIEDCSNPQDINCPITVTVHYRIHTFTSDMSLPGIGRFGLPNYYQLDYNMQMPIR